MVLSPDIEKMMTKLCQGHTILILAVACRAVKVSINLASHTYFLFDEVQKNFRCLLDQTQAVTHNGKECSAISVILFFCPST